MATTIRGVLRHFLQKYRQKLTSENVKSSVKKRPFAIPCLFFSGLSWYLYLKKRQIEEKHTKLSVKRENTEKCFLKFASSEFHGQIYMSPVDFLESLLEVTPGKRMKRKKLTEGDLEHFYSNTPPVHKGSSKFFRHLKNDGIISYSEYLILLSMLTKPISAFQLCFKMMDRNYDQTIDKDEFLMLEKIFAQKWTKKGATPKEKIFDSDGGPNFVKTTLMVHFFGLDGNDVLDYATFEKFLMDLQKEMTELEFAQFSHGLELITPVDFAKIILRYTYHDSDSHDEYISRLLERIGDDLEANSGISFEDFCTFVNFLHNLKDFNLVMKFYAILQTPVTMTEFKNAVKLCTGQDLSDHLLQTLFTIFDDNNDGVLSYNEFILVMNDRLHRGFCAKHKENWASFKHCIKETMLRGTPVLLDDKKKKIKHKLF